MQKKRERKKENNYIAQYESLPTKYILAQNKSMDTTEFIWDFVINYNTI